MPKVNHNISKDVAIFLQTIDAAEITPEEAIREINRTYNKSYKLSEIKLLEFLPKPIKEFEDKIRNKFDFITQDVLEYSRLTVEAAEDNFFENLKKDKNAKTYQI